MQVSVIIPVYNAAPFLDKSIRSALDQKQTSEVILIDDRSTDESLEICKKWELLDSRVKVYVNEGIKGAGAARNVGLRNATCEYIAFLDADDYYLEGRFSETENLFSNHPDLDAIGESVKVISTTDTSRYVYGFKRDYHNINISEFLTMPSFYIIGLTLKKSAALKLGNFNEKLKQTQDTDYLARAVSECKVISGIYNRTVAVYCLHDNNTTNNINERNKYRAIFYKIYVQKAIYEFKNFKLFIKMLRYYRIYYFLSLYDGDNSKKTKFLNTILFPFHLVKLILLR